MDWSQFNAPLPTAQQTEVALAQQFIDGILTPTEENKSDLEYSLEKLSGYIQELKSKETRSELYQQISESLFVRRDAIRSRLGVDASGVYAAQREKFAKDKEGTAFMNAMAIIHRPLVQALVKKTLKQNTSPTSLGFDDLVQIGTYGSERAREDDKTFSSAGLIAAAFGYKQQEALFSTYAFIPIENTVIRALSQDQKHARRHIRWPGDSRRVGAAEDEPIGGGDVFIDNSNPNNFGIAMEGVRDGIERVLNTLTYREREITKMCNGINTRGRDERCEGELTYQEIGGIFRVTGGQTRKIERKAISELRHPDRASQLEPLEEDIASARAEAEGGRSFNRPQRGRPLRGR